MGNILQHLVQIMCINISEVIKKKIIKELLLFKICLK